MVKRYRPTARRKMIWARRIGQGAAAAVNVPAAGLAHDLLEQFRTDGGQALGSTVTRVRLDVTFTWAWTSGGAFSSGDQIAWGILVDQLQPDQAEVPRPGEEPHADWMYWRRTGPVPDYTAIPTSTGTAFSYQIAHTIDVRSQRKMEELGQTLWFVIDPTFVSGGATMLATWNASTLLKLP